MIEQVANTVRGLAADMVEKAKSGHPGMPLGTADLTTVLFSEILKHDPTSPTWPDRDRFVLSAGHGSALLYSMLHLTGYPLSLDDLKQFRQLGSITPGHPEYGVTPGVETTTGPLGQGIATAVGMALAERMLAARVNRPGYEIINHYTYVIAGDGCMMEGISSEASSLAGDWGLGKLIVIYDDNEISIEGDTNLAFREEVGQRYLAYGWQVLKIDGHDPEAILKAIQEAKANLAKPTLIIAATKIAKGSPLEGNPEAHGAPLGRENILALKRNLGLPETDFTVPQEVYQFFKEKRLDWQKNRLAWEKRFQEWSNNFPELKAEWDRILSRGLPEGLEESMPLSEIGSAFATRDAGGKVLNSLAAKLGELIGGSADLAPSTKTYLKGFADISSQNFNGRNIHFGVRENAMGAIMNGLSVHGGFRVFGSTFLVFADYLRPTIRMAALMKQPVIYVFTHDSIYVGEDGPTHQPIEQLESLRIIPGLRTYRPADANETNWSWLAALQRTHGPTAIILTRQKLPTLPGTSFAGVKKGGYIIRPTDNPQVVILASGSEVPLALQAADLLENEGTRVRVLSVPCREELLASDPGYLREVLGENGLRVALEAGVDSGWYQLVGPLGLVIGINRFGESGPPEAVAAKFGFTPQAVVDEIKKYLT